MNLSLKTLYLILAMTLIFTAVPISAAHLEELQDQPVLSEQVVDTEVISIESTEEVKNPSVEIENVEDYVKSFVQSMSNEENNWNKKTEIVRLIPLHDLNETINGYIIKW